LAFAADRLELMIKDDGEGFDAEKQVDQGHFGLIGMRERARLLEGTFTIESAPGRGTQIKVRAPLAAHAGRELT
jgi:signal transduction histidine kinase